MSQCIYCGKQILVKKNKFCNSSCAAKYNNSHRTSTTKGKTKICKCVKCGVEFEASIHISKSKAKCKDCKQHNRPHSKKIESILDCSKATSMKIIKRANKGCSICGWNESTCDIHHIIPKNKGGSNENSNLIIVCPNCHRRIHTNNDFSIDYLQTLSIDKIFKDWYKYYHISN